MAMIQYPSRFLDDLSWLAALLHNLVMNSIQQLQGPVVIIGAPHFWALPTLRNSAQQALTSCRLVNT
jgi:hypothetical protein